MRTLSAPPMPEVGSALTGKPLAMPKGTQPARLSRLKGQRIDRRTQIRLGQTHPLSGKEFEGLGHEGY